MEAGAYLIREDLEGMGEGDKWQCRARQTNKPENFKLGRNLTNSQFQKRRIIKKERASCHVT